MTPEGVVLRQVLMGQCTGELIDLKAHGPKCRLGVVRAIVETRRFLQRKNGAGRVLQRSLSVRTDLETMVDPE